VAEEKTEHRQAETKRRRRPLRWWAGVVMLAAAVLLALLWLSELLTRRSVEQQLAAIEAARAIPDQENAAIIYDRLMKDYGRSQVPWGVVNNATDTTPKEPWLSEDNPQLATWIKGQHALIAGLLEAGRKPQCRFAITGYPEKQSLRNTLQTAMITWAFLLLRAASNDIAEDRIEPGVEKYLAAIKMGGHLAQQPVIEDGIVGLAVESWPLHRMRPFIVEGPFEQEHLEAIQAALPPIDNQWDNFSPQIREVDRLYSIKEDADWLAWMRRFWQDTGEPSLERLHELYLGRLSSRRATLVLIALRHHKDKTEQWPQSLDQVRDSLPAEALVDAVNGSSFVYKLTEDVFTLYSKGQNNIDEDGQYAGRKKGSPDDRLYWPPWSRVIEQRKAAEKDGGRPDG
jgi:hypothetical protein